MTTITNPGSVTSISFKASQVSIVSLSGGSSGSPTIVTHADADVLVILASNGGTGNWFALDSNFVIGDVIEWRQMDAITGLVLKDASGNVVITSNSAGDASIARKVLSGTANDWLIVSKP